MSLLTDADRAALFGPIWKACQDTEKRVREEVAREIEAHYLGADYGRNLDGTESPDTALGHAYDEGLEQASRIARDRIDRLGGGTK